MNKELKWFVRYRSGKKGYIPAREISPTKYEIFGDYMQDHKACEILVRGLNSGAIKIRKRKYENR